MNSATLAAAALKAQRQLEGLSSAPRNRLPRIDSVGNLGRDSVDGSLRDGVAFCVLQLTRNTLENGYFQGRAKEWARPLVA